jgi:hypothetical protein
VPRNKPGNGKKINKLANKPVIKSTAKTWVFGVSLQGERVLQLSEHTNKPPSNTGDIQKRRKEFVLNLVLSSVPAVIRSF